LPAAPVEKKKAGGLFAGWRRKKEEMMEPKETSSQAGDVRAVMERILRRFVERIAGDSAMKAFAAGKQVTMYFVLSDLGLDFYTAYQDGAVRAELGEPPGKKDVTLRMSADLLDGMFTGRTNPTRAAMGGKLSFSGDTMKAMSLQRIQKDLTRMYSEARAEIGDPGDLTKVGPQAQAPEAKRPSAPLAAPVVARPIAAEENDPRREVIAVLTELFHSGLITGTGGNISVRIPGHGHEVWITPSQIFKGSLRPDHLVRIDLEGNPLDPDSASASSERFVHCAILRRRPDVEAVVHSHAPEATTLALAGLPFLPISTEAVFVGEIPRVPFIMPGTTELAEQVAAALGDGVAVLMQNHGLVVAGSSLRRAADVTEIIEQTAKKIVACAMMGKQPPVLPEEVVAKLKDVGKMMV
jgi:autoinducer 2 (AI-2) kinase